MQQCSKDTLMVLFFNLPSSLHLLFLFFYFSSLLLAKFFTSLSRKTTIFFPASSNEGNEAVIVHEEEEEDVGYFTFECSEREDHLVADVICGGEALSFLHVKSPLSTINHENIVDDVPDHGGNIEEPIFEDPYELFVMEDQLPLIHGSQLASDHSGQLLMEDVVRDDDDDDDDDEEEEEETPPDYTNSLTMSTQLTVSNDGVPVLMEPTQIDHTSSDQEEAVNKEAGINLKEVKDHHDDPIVKTNISVDGKFVILETKKLQALKDDHVVVEEIYGDSYTDGSTSKSSSEWRKSLNYRDSGTDDPFSCSSRRSCPTWESYSMFRKYDEEMIFLDKISAQKLNETESLKAVEGCPGSISQRIVHKLMTKNKRSWELIRNPYQELESAYVAQVCLAWEALSWNYKSLKQLRASPRCDDGDSFCPAQIAQQFQQFQVLLQRFIENEPFEHGRRPEIYARIRRSAPKLLQVPEFRDSEGDYKELGEDTMISTTKFLRIMEDAIRTFMNFLKADREKIHSQIYKAIFKRNNRSTVDPSFLHLLKRTNRKTKRKLEDLCRAQKCLRKRKLKEEEEMEILMSLIDLKLVSRVLRMSEISQQQLQWCEEKMGKVKVWEGKVQRDSSPLSFTEHTDPQRYVA